MKQMQQRSFGKPTRSGSPLNEGGPIADRLLHVVDAGLVGIVCVAPFVFGGRHDLGRFLFVLLVAVTSAAWFLRQGILPKAYWTRSVAHCIVMLAIALLVLQLVPLPDSWIAQLSQRTHRLLPLWTHGAAAVELGQWNTISLTPHETTLSLAMLLSYGLLFVVLTQRIRSRADIEKLLNTVAVAAVLMAGFGLLQFFTSNGRFFWCYEYPFRTTNDGAMGSFVNRNHFASFLVLGVGPLIRWLLDTLRSYSAQRSRRRSNSVDTAYIPVLLLIAGLTIVLLAIVLSLSRGGAIALVAAAIAISVVYLRWRLVDGKYLYGLAGLALCLFAVLSIYGYDKVAHRYSTLTEGSFEAVDHEQGRRRVWAANLAAIKDGWITGTGAGSHRDVCPIYLPEPTSKVFSHAESGYLQVVTENGVGGAGLLVFGIGLVAYWCVACMGRLTQRADQLCLGAVMAGLVASAVHSLIDFVWYIPACISVTLVLVVCLLRLSQLTLTEEQRPTTRWLLARPRWFEFSTVVVLVGGWTVTTYFGPAMASVHWDHYLRASVASSRLARHQLSALLNRRELAELPAAEPLSTFILEHLEQIVYWNPSSARAHLRLASNYLARFELLQADEENVMPLGQIRDAALLNDFESPQARRDWLNRAFGDNAELLYRAYDHARRAAALCPIQGKAYLHMANLCFLDGAGRPVVEVFVDQGVRVNPYDGDVLFDVGLQKLVMTGRLEAAFHYWKKCFQSPGPHQLRIVQSVAGHIPAAAFVEAFQPDWHTLHEIWVRYRQFGTPQDLNNLVTYAAAVTKRQVKETGGIPPPYLWLWQASMYKEIGRPDDALACLEQAYRSGSHLYAIRVALGKALMKAKRFNEAEPHLRWCLARRPENRWLSEALVEIAKLRVAQRDADGASTDYGGTLWRW